MEGAIRSGRTAADAVAAHFGHPNRCLVPDLVKNPLVWLLVGG